MSFLCGGVRAVRPLGGGWAMYAPMACSSWAERCRCGNAVNACCRHGHHCRCGNDLNLTLPHRQRYLRPDLLTSNSSVRASCAFSATRSYPLSSRREVTSSIALSSAAALTSVQASPLEVLHLRLLAGELMHGWLIGVIKVIAAIAKVLGRP